MNAGSLLVRADASPDMGTGHVMRCLALAQAWQDAGGKAAFAMSQCTPAIRQRLISESCEILSLSDTVGDERGVQETIALAQSRNAKWIIVDGYGFGAEHQDQLKSAGLKVLFLDDYGHAGRYSADIVLNQNISATEQWYTQRESYTRLLLGPKYSLLRREFGKCTLQHKVVSPVCRRVLVLMGGSDPANLSARVLEALEFKSPSEIEVTLIMGGSNPHLEELKKLAAKSRLSIQVLHDVYSLSDIMTTADIAVSAAGSTCLELCLLGIPTLLFDVAENQTAAAEAAHKLGCAIHVGNGAVTRERIAESVISLIDSPDIRRSLSENSRRLVDGHGASRVASILRSTQVVTVRYATAEDRQLLWDWANDPEVRAASFSSQPIPWESHIKWFEQKLTSRETSLFIAEDEEGNAIGQVRFERKGRGAELHISLAKPKRGAGLAVPTVQAAVRELFAQSDCEHVHAYVKPENIASAKVFEKSGFVRVGNASVRGNPALDYLRRRT